MFLNDYELYFVKQALNDRIETLASAIKRESPKVQTVRDENRVNEWKKELDNLKSAKEKL